MNKDLINLDIKDIAESIHNSPDQSSAERERKLKDCSTLKLSLSNLKKRSISKIWDDNEENINTENFHDKINDYSAQVRVMNKKKFNSNNKKSIWGLQEEKKQNIYEIPRYKTQSQSIIFEESDTSESTDNFVTSYQRYREKKK